MGLDKGIMTYIHRYNIIQSIFTALKNFCTLCIHLPSPRRLLASIHLFTVSIVLPFPEWHIVGISFFFFFLNRFIYLFLAALGLRCCLRAFSSCSERGLLFVAVRGLLIAVASRCGARALGARASIAVARGLSSCGLWALERRLSSCGTRA